MCEVRLFPWWKFTDICDGDIRKPCYSKWVRGQTGLWATASAHGRDRVPFEVGHLCGSWRTGRGRAAGFAMALSLALRCPRGRPAPLRGRRRRSPRRDRGGRPLNQLPQKWKQSQKNVAGKDTSSDKKVQTKGEKGSKGETGWSGKKLKKTYL